MSSSIKYNHRHHHHHHHHYLDLLLHVLVDPPEPGLHLAAHGLEVVPPVLPQLRHLGPELPELVVEASPHVWQMIIIFLEAVIKILTFSRHFVMNDGQFANF